MNDDAGKRKDAEAAAPSRLSSSIKRLLDDAIVSPEGMVYLTLFLLGLWGCLAIYNATAFCERPFHFAFRQFLWLIIGSAVLWLCSKIRSHVYWRCVPIIAVVAYVPLWLVLIPGLGVEVNGMRGWFALPESPWLGPVYLQPSEVGKVPFVLLLCWIGRRVDSPMKRFPVLLGVASLWIFPIALQPDFGTLLIYVAAFLVVYWVSDGSVLVMIGVLLAAVPGVCVLAVKVPYVSDRLRGFWSPGGDPTGAGWHVLQFQYTMARGGLWGTDWGKSLWSNAYLPLAYSDSSFASLTEAVGFIGALPVIAGFLLLAWLCAYLAAKTEDSRSRLFILAMGVVIVIQAFVHISVNTGLIPPTGITLPMLSYGGSSLVSTLLAFGVILSLAKDD